MNNMSPLDDLIKDAQEQQEHYHKNPGSGIEQSYWTTRLLTLREARQVYEGHLHSEEFDRCKSDPKYFIEKYARVKMPEPGSVKVVARERAADDDLQQFLENLRNANLIDLNDETKKTILSLHGCLDFSWYINTGMFRASRLLYSFTELDMDPIIAMARLHEVLSNKGSIELRSELELIIHKVKAERKVLEQSSVGPSDFHTLVEMEQEKLKKRLPYLFKEEKNGPIV